MDPSGHGETSLDGNPLSLKEFAECLRDIEGASGSDGSVLVRFVGKGEAEAIANNGGRLIASAGIAAKATTRVLPLDTVPRVIGWFVEKGYTVAIGVRPGWERAISNPDGMGFVVDVPIINQFIGGILIKRL